MRVYKNCNVEMAVLLMICVFLYRKNLKRTKGCVGNDDESDKTNEILYKKQNRRMAVQLKNCFFVRYKNLKKTKDGIWRLMPRTMNLMKVCLKHHLYMYAFIIKVFTIVVKTTVACV